MCISCRQHVDFLWKGGVKDLDFLVDVINVWSLMRRAGLGRLTGYGRLPVSIMCLPHFLCVELLALLSSQDFCVSWPRHWCQLKRESTANFEQCYTKIPLDYIKYPTTSYTCLQGCREKKLLGRFMGFCIEFTLFSYSLGFLTVKIHWGGGEPLPTRNTPMHV